jgi:hypothetical protein
MANTFTSYLTSQVGTTASTVVTVGSSTQTTVIGMSIANVIASPATCDVYITRSSINYYLIKGATVAPGGTLVIVGGDQKVVLTTGDALKVVASTAASMDVITSVLNIT